MFRANEEKRDILVIDGIESKDEKREEFYEVYEEIKKTTCEEEFKDVKKPNVSIPLEKVSIPYIKTYISDNKPSVEFLGYEDNKLYLISCSKE
jgi:hypothetical protein